ncbi:hypothetical protein [Streptomyces sp. NPDC051567]|uniref:hypothetical protein n=1 Tax=Streptomyces sp. NPDC051567 TaxID=3365660 RepID=UPI00379BBA45
MSPLPLPPVAAPYQLPFHYGALHTIGLDHLVDPEPVRAVLAEHHPALTAAEFDGRALVSLNYQLYFAQYPSGGGITQEIEVNIVAHPAAAADRLPQVSYAQYAQGYDQTKLLGIARVHVLCDNPLAIDAGRALYAEPKYPGCFQVSVPSPNGPAGDVWDIDCHAADLAPDGGVRRRGDALFSLAADLDGLPFATADSTPVTGYGTEPGGRTLAGPMNVHHPYRWFDLAGPGARGRARLTVHDGGGEVGRDLVRLIGDTPAAGAWTFQSPPVAAHHRPYYLA